jgi:hypothetical protein
MTDKVGRAPNPLAADIPRDIAPILEGQPGIDRRPTTSHDIESEAAGGEDQMGRSSQMRV